MNGALLKKTCCLYQDTRINPYLLLSTILNGLPNNWRKQKQNRIQQIFKASKNSWREEKENMQESNFIKPWSFLLISIVATAAVKMGILPKLKLTTIT